MASSVQKILPLDTIRSDTLILKGGALRSVVLASSINFSLKSADEQTAIIARFQDFLNSLDFSLQILVQSRKVSMKGYLDSLGELQSLQTNELLKIQIKDYISFIQNLTQSVNIMSKHFFVVIPFNPFEMQEKKQWLKTLKMIFKPGKLAKLPEEEFSHYKNQLWQRVEYVIGGLARFGVTAQPLNTQELIELFWGTYNPGEMEMGFVPEIPEEIV